MVEIRPVICINCRKKNPPPYNENSKWWCSGCGRSHIGYQDWETRFDDIYDGGY